MYGQGFLFDDADPKSSPIAVMKSVLSVCPKCAERIFPYIGGEELNSQPEPNPKRYAIYFSDIPEEKQLGEWPPLESIIRERVKPVRDALGDNPNNVPLKRRWWAYQAHRPGLYAAAKRRSRMLACSQVTTHLSFIFLPPTWIYSQKLCVFDIEDYCRFATLQGRCHDYWSWFLCSTMKDDLNYSSSDCFATFPFPAAIEDNRKLKIAGREYYEFRAALMLRRNEGMTKTYNRFHDPIETAEDIQRLRELHAAMDRDVLEAYGWHDLAARATPVFLDETNEDDHTYQGRLFWPSDFRDEVLARLLALNAERHAEEVRLGIAPGIKKREQEGEEDELEEA